MYYKDQFYWYRYISRARLLAGSVLAHALTVCAINYSEPVSQPSSHPSRAHTPHNAIRCSARQSQKMRNKTDDSQRKSQKKLKQPHDNTRICWVFFFILSLFSHSLNFKCMHIIFVLFLVFVLFCHAHNSAFSLFPSTGGPSTVCEIRENKNRNKFLYNQTKLRTINRNIFKNGRKFS